MEYLVKVERVVPPTPERQYTDTKAVYLQLLDIDTPEVASALVKAISEAVNKEFLL